MGSLTHFLEIDLLGQGKPMPILNHQIQSQYRILVSRSQERPRANLYAFNLQDEIPLFALPLRPEDSEPVINLHSLLNDIYDQGCYDLIVDYSKETVPALSETDATWTDNLLRDQGLR